jgi:hypothetical protein
MTTPPLPAREQDLVRKLVTTWHLSVPEHRALPGGRIRASLIYDAIEEVLQAEGRFPVEWQPDDSFAGGLIERLGDGRCRVTWRAEFSMMHHEAITIQDFRSQRDAIKSFASSFFGGDIDGIPIDWSA